MPRSAKILAMATTRDYYEVLGVAKNASDNDIKQAYRKLAREHHPDMVKDGDKTAAEKRFKEINEAYQVLSDSQKRKMYDTYGHTAGGPSGQGAGGFSGGQWGPFSYSYTSNGNGANGGFGNIDPFDVFEEFFGFRGFGGQARQPKKGKNLHYELQINFADVVHGIEKEINVESGKVTIKIPQGVQDGTELRFSGKGMPGPNNLPAGDLFITLRVSTPKIFQRFGDDLGVALELDFFKVVLGDVVNVPVVDLKSTDGLGTAQLKIPAGTQYGTQFRIRGKGMPRLRGNGQGDVIAQIYIKIPNKITKKQKELLEEYKNAK